jgi:hypothetical protein
MGELINTSFYYLSFVCAVIIIDDDFYIDFFSATYKNVRLEDNQGLRGIS